MDTTGTYILILYLPQDNLIRVGRLGQLHFPKGYYAYVGSAFGRGGLAGRLKHHLSPTENPHWHIDYFRRYAAIQEIWLSASHEKREHDWADLLLMIPGSIITVEQFGSSDCQCASHLVYFECSPDLEDFTIVAHKKFPHDVIIKATP